MLNQSELPIHSPGLFGSFLIKDVIMHRTLFTVLVCSLWFSCKGPAENEGCTPIADADKAMELAAPLSGTYSVGNSVEVAWKVDAGEVDLVILQVSTSGSAGPWENIYRGISVPGDSGVVCMDTVWVIGQEYDDVDYSSPVTLLLRAAWYNHEGNSYDWAKDVSNNLIINP